MYTGTAQANSNMPSSLSKYNSIHTNAPNLPCPWPACTFGAVAIEEICNHFVCSHCDNNVPRHDSSNFVDDEYLENQETVKTNIDVDDPSLLFGISNHEIELLKEELNEKVYKVRLNEDEQQKHLEMNGSKNFAETDIVKKIEYLLAENNYLRRTVVKYKEENIVLKEKTNSLDLQ
ncbi:5624_t:CDS:2 [Ambispora leptoticha]|uniref:5624_t:CDS:1 n=1 Tax=Ambispora leptoticha TaxID=144679 RepID=A0A9N8ZN25_9GLOM|nr:5624_t:CDS:2 [Ambispora leptoticha]